MGYDVGECTAVFSRFNFLMREIYSTCALQLQNAVLIDWTERRTAAARLNSRAVEVLCWSGDRGQLP
jgi:hypothetical protein